MIEARGEPNQGTVNLKQRPDPLYLELNGTWYYYDPDTDDKAAGAWSAYHSHRWQDLQLDHRWLRKTDDRPLELKPFLAKRAAGPLHCPDRRVRTQNFAAAVNRGGFRAP